VTSDDSFPKLDLPKYHLSEIRISVFLQKGEPIEVHDKTDATPEVPLQHFAPYSRRRQKHLLFEVARRHTDDPGKYLLEVIYQVGPELPTNPVPKQFNFGPAAMKFLSMASEVEQQVAGLEYRFDINSSYVKRLLIAFPVIADPTTMYPMLPARMPVDGVTSIGGYKNTDSGVDLAYNFHLSLSEVGAQLRIGFPFNTIDSLESMVPGIIDKGEGILRHLGVLSR
jgi:hypothetical protein